MKVYKHVSFKHTVISTAVLGIMCSSAYAEETTTAVQEDQQEKVVQLQTIVVTGQRASNKRAIATKRSQERITDSISADDAKQLPDSTVAETIRRIPGVSVTFNIDNVHSRDEAERPVLRGLDAKYNNSTVDGLAIASADSNTLRGARMDLLPSTMIDRLDVYKSWSPEVDANSIGGSVDILTRSAFANGGKTQVNGSVGLGYVTQHGKPEKDDKYPLKGDIAASTTWGDDDLKFGASVAAYYSKVDSYTVGHATSDSVFYNWYDADGNQVTDANGGPSKAAYAVPQNSKYFWFNNSREKMGGTVKFEAKTDNIYGFISAGYYKYQMEETRNENYLNINATGKCSPTDLTATSGNFACAEGESGIMYSPDDHRTTKVLQTGGNWDINDKNQLSFRYGWSEAERGQHYYMAKYSNDAYATSGSTATKASDTLALGYDTSGFEQVFTLDNPSAWTNMQNWKFHYYRDDEEKLKNTTNDARLDWKYNLNSDDRGFGFGAGFNHRENEVQYDRERWDYQAAKDGLTAEGVMSDTGLALPSGGGLNLLTIDLEAVYKQLAANPDYVKRIATNDTLYSLQDDFNFKETINAGYTMAAYATDRFRVTGGYRLDSAENASSAWQKVTKDGSLVWEPNSANSKYHYWLPSLNMQFKVTPDFLIRAAASKTIGRPDYKSFVPQSSITENTDGTLTVSYGNPDIKPRESTNLDLSFEKYFNNGLVALGLFNKDIKNEIYSRQTTQSFDYNGQTYTAYLTRDENSSDAQVKGIEINTIINSLGFIHPALARFGASANYTRMDGSLDVSTTTGATRTIDRLTGQPDYIYNASVFYAGNKFNARLAFNRTGMSLRDIKDVNYSYQDVFWKARSQLDFSAGYQINKNFTAFIEGKNLTKEKVTSVTGPNRNLLKDTYIVGASGWLGLKFKF